ncbi:MAG: hypothetical protein IPI45_11450 [Saprospiraceae bacterium]|nr:hypothetical protein [Saprospiraceae bacterium]MBK7738378.1 hypothetical protein [Saprospiraceae bacterium]MBK7913049.1 hypothetical protein [Saprospiraceae bacterium]
MKNISNILSGLLIFCIFSSCSKNAPQCKEQIKADCICTMDYNPVCGCNLKTYPNACSAQCSGIYEFKAGKCPQ